MNLKVAIIGMPNAGKSTLFNCILGYKRSLVSSIAGTTNDVVQETIGNINVNITDTPGIMKNYQKSIYWKDILKNDVVICLVDGSQEISNEELNFFKVVKRYFSNKFLFAVNKCDKKIIEEKNLLGLGLGTPIYISALAQKGINNLLLEIQNLSERLGKPVDFWKEDDEEHVQTSESPVESSVKPFSVLILGRSNSGKSTIFNLLCEENKSIISNNPFETRDIIKSQTTYKDIFIDIMDSPGIICNQVEEMKINAEKILVEFIKTSQIMVLVIDNLLGFSSYDKRVVFLCKQLKKPLVIIENIKNNFTADYNLERQCLNYPIVSIERINNNSREKILSLIKKPTCYIVET